MPIGLWLYGRGQCPVPSSAVPDDQPSNHFPTYRAYRVNPGKRVSSAAIIVEATNDEEAIAQARQLVDGVGIEVWDRTRRVAVLPPKGEDGEGQVS